MFDTHTIIHTTQQKLHFCKKSEFGCYLGISDCERKLARLDPHRVYYKKVEAHLTDASAVCDNARDLSRTQLEWGHLCAEAGRLGPAHVHYLSASEAARTASVWKGPQSKEEVMTEAACRMAECIYQFAESGKYLEDAQMRRVLQMLDGAEESAETQAAFVAARVVIHECLLEWAELIELEVRTQSSPAKHTHTHTHRRKRYPRVAPSFWTAYTQRTRAPANQRACLRCRRRWTCASPAVRCTKSCVCAACCHGPSCALGAGRRPGQLATPCWTGGERYGCSHTQRPDAPVRARYTRTHAQQAIESSGMEGWALWEQQMNYLRGYAKLAKKRTSRDLKYPLCVDMAS